MDLDTVVLRRWAALIRTSDEAAYTAYMGETGCADFAKTPGNLGYQVLLRELGDSTSEVTILSWWRTMADIKLFAGDPLEVARYYPNDDQFLLTRPRLVEHHRVVAGTMALSG